MAWGLDDRCCLAVLVNMYLHVIECFEELENKNFSNFWGNWGLVLSKIFYHQIKWSGEKIHDYIEIIILRWGNRYFVRYFNIIINHEDNVFMINSGNYSQLSVFIPWVLKDLFDSIEFVIFFVFGLSIRKKVPNILCRKFPVQSVWFFHSGFT